MKPFSLLLLTYNRLLMYLVFKILLSYYICGATLLYRCQACPSLYLSKMLSGKDFFPSGMDVYGLRNLNCE